MNIKETSITKTKHEGTITSKDIIRALELPKDAKLEFDVPSGGDYSGMSLDVESIRVSWTTESKQSPLTRECPACADYGAPNGCRVCGIPIMGG